MVGLAIQASQRITSRGASQDLTLEVDMPPGMTCLRSAGRYKVLKTTTQTRNGRSVLTLAIQVPNAQFNGTPGAQIRQEFRNQALYLKAPQTIAPNEAYIEVRLSDGKEAPQTWRWAAALTQLKPPAQRPRKLVLGLWSYGLGSAGPASKGIAQLLSDSGIRYISQDEAAEFREAIKSQGILVGGHMYYGLFYDRRAEDQNARGAKLRGEFPNPVGIAELPAGSTIAGVSQMVQRARQGDGLVTMDYEPTALKGWAPEAVAIFKKQYGVSDADLARFRAHVAKAWREASLTDDP
jgi:hypothetical protein